MWRFFKDHQVTNEDEEFNRIEREASLRKAAVRATVKKPVHYDDDIQDYVRPFVGLTDEEVAKLVKEFRYAPIQLAVMVEAFLRDKNS